MFISQSPTGFGATGFQRQPTPSEQKKIDLAIEKGGGKALSEMPVGEVITNVGTSFFSGGITQLLGDLTKEEMGKLYDPDKSVTGFLDTVTKLTDPRTHFEVFKSRKEYELAVEKFLKIFQN